LATAALSGGDHPSANALAMIMTSATVITAEHAVEIGDADARFRSLTEHIDATTPAGRRMMQMVFAFAQFERVISLGTEDGGRRWRGFAISSR
jgi:hypothetical protein